MTIMSAVSLASEIGAGAIHDPAEVGAEADVMTMLPDSRVIEADLFGAGRRRPGSARIDMSSGAAQRTVVFGQHLARHDVRPIDATASGGIRGALREGLERNAWDCGAGQSERDLAQSLRRE